MIGRPLRIKNYHPLLSVEHLLSYIRTELSTYEHLYSIEDYSTYKGVYFAITDGHPYVKIGCSDDIITRIKHIQFHCPLRLVLHSYIRMTRNSDKVKIERAIHLYFKPQHRIGEWFFINEEIYKFMSNFDRYENKPYTIVME